MQCFKRFLHLFPLREAMHCEYTQNQGERQRLCRHCFLSRNIRLETAVRYLLHVIDELARMIPVGHGMADKNRNGYLHPPVRFKIFPELDEGKKELAFRVGVLRKGGVAQPRQARYGTEIGRLSGTCLDDARHIPIPLHVCHYCLIKSIEVFTVFAPDVGEGFALRMEKRIAGHDFIPIAQLPLLIEAHPKLLVLIDRLHDDIKHDRKETKASFFLPCYQTGDIYIGVQIVFALDLVIVVGNR